MVCGGTGTRAGPQGAPRVCYTPPVATCWRPPPPPSMPSTCALATSTGATPHSLIYMYTSRFVSHAKCACTNIYMYLMQQSNNLSIKRENHFTSRSLDLVIDEHGVCSRPCSSASAHGAGNSACMPSNEGFLLSHVECCPMTFGTDKNSPDLHVVCRIATD